MPFTPTAEDFYVQWDTENRFSFFEGEQGDIFSFGHRDFEELIEEIRMYDLFSSGELHDVSDYPMNNASHTWAVIVVGETPEDDWQFAYGDRYLSIKNSFPITVVAR